MAGGKIAATAFAKATAVKKSAKAMKPSGVAWLGDIPEGWEMRRLKTCFSIVSGSGFKEHLQGRTDGDYPVFKARDIGKADVTLNYSKNWITSDEVETEGFKIIPANSILMPKIGEAMRKNSRAISGVACCVDNNCQGLLPRMVDVKLSYYLLCSIDVRAFDNGGAIPCINNQAFLDFSCPLPPLSEQRAIADYLDEKCGAIDAAIVEAKKGIEEYKAWKKSLIFEAVTGKRRVGVFNAEKRGRREVEKMKPSGIPWIGAIPAGWRVVKASRLIASTQNGLTRRNLSESKGDIVLRLKNISPDGYIDYSDVVRIELSEKEKDTYCLTEGDLLFARVNGSRGLVGKCAVFVDNEECVAYNDHLIRVRVNGIVVRSFITYYLSSQSGRTEIELHTSTSAGQFTISGEGLRDIAVVLPPLPEQQAIADYLDEKCATIDAMVTEKESLIADLEAYKKSLIYETVTGKREVA